MLDIVIVRREPERVRGSAKRRGLDPAFVDDVLRLDEQYRSALTEVERAKAEKNRLSAEIGKASDKAAAARDLRPALDALSARIAGSETTVSSLSPDTDGSELRNLLTQTPNLLDDSVPDGRDESDNAVVRAGGRPTALTFEPKMHWELGEALGILDFERAAKLSGSRFVLLRGDGARLQRAVGQFFLDRAASKGYVEISPPLLVSRGTMWSTGQLTKFSDAMFRDEEADLFMIPTAEVPLTAMHGAETIDAAQLPKRYSAFTSCFRKEAGAAGRDTRGLIRLHQFEKVELVALSLPENSAQELEAMTSHAESLLAELELPYRVTLLCAGDVGFNSAKTYDIEAWLPGANCFREISSCSNCTDFQARRAGIRFRRDPKSKPEFVHTLNGSGLAIGRTVAAILENYQEPDGSVRIPKALQPYMHGDILQRSLPF